MLAYSALFTLTLVYILLFYETKSFYLLAASFLSHLSPSKTYCVHEQAKEQSRQELAEAPRDAETKVCLMLLEQKPPLCSKSLLPLKTDTKFDGEIA